MDHPTPSNRNRFVPPLMLLLGLMLTLLTFERIRTAEQEAVRADREAGAAQLGLLVQSLASSIETDLTATVNVALATDGDAQAYRRRTAIEGDDAERALLQVRPTLAVAATTGGEAGDAAAASLLQAVHDEGLAGELSQLAEDGGFRFLLLDDPDAGRTLLLAAGASRPDRAFVEVRRFELGAAGPAIVTLVDGIESFAVYATDRPDPSAAILASTDEVPLRGDVANSTATVGGQDLLIEVRGASGAPIPPIALLGIGAVLSTALAGLLLVSQRRRDQAVDALEEARHANEARRRMEADLQQAQRMEAVGQLAGGIAHDFNNLLAAITATAELVADDVEDPRMREDLDEIRNAARRGAALTRRLLSFARRDVEAREVLDLNVVIQDVLPLLRRSITEAVELDLDLGEGPVPILGDAGEIEQILLNLVVNARDAGHGTDQRITVSTRSAEGSALLSVADRGVGMTPDVIARAFEPFFSTRAASGGTGLGLAIVYGIAQRMGGAVRIASEPGVGTTVSVSLPLHLESGADVDETDRREPVPPASGGEDILLVEDEPTVRRATRRLLERAGHRVVDAADGIEAVAVVEDGFEPSVVLTDVVLPGSINGRDLAERVLQMVPAARVVFASGYPSEIISHRQLLDDGARFLPKPFSSDALLDAVRADEPASADR